MKKIGILYDNISGNTGDVAIGISLKKILKQLNVEFDELIPGNFNPLDYETIIIGGGYLLRQSPDFFYDKFRVPGNHILNAMGIYGEPKDLDYLRNYKYITVRSNGDKKKLAYLNENIHVIPCTTMLLEDVPDLLFTFKKPSIGIHIFPMFSTEEEDQFIRWASSLPFTVYFVPITHYNKDIQYMRYLKEKIPNSEVLPILKAQEIFTICGKFDFFISYSLHGAIFSYVHNVPFILFDAADKMQFFMEERQLDHYLFKNFKELQREFEELERNKPDYSKKILADKKILNDYLHYLSSVLPVNKTHDIEINETSSETIYQIANLLSDISELERQTVISKRQISNLTLQTHNLEVIVTDRDNQITELKQHARNLETTITDRDSQIIELKLRARNLETTITNRDSQIAELRQHARNLETTITNRDSQIAELRQHARNLESIIIDPNNHVSEQRQYIHHLESIVTDRDYQIAGLTQHASNLEATITDRDNQIAGLTQHTSNLEATVTGQNQQLQEVIRFNQSLSDENQSIKKSVTYNVTTRFHKKIIERLLPHNTRRRKYYNLGLSGCRLLINEGWDRFWWCYQERKHLTEVTTGHFIPIPLSEIKQPELGNFPVIQTKISVIIPTKNAGPDFQSVLEKIKNQKGIASVEIIIVDSGSIDTTCEVAEKYGGRIFKIKPEEFNHGLTRNYGAELASGEFIVFLVQDAIPIGDYWLYNMVNFFENDEKIAAVTCRQVPRSDADLFAGFILWSHYRSLTRTQNRVYSCDTKFDELAPLDKRIAAGIEDTCCMIQKRIFDQFKFRNIQYGEDLDIGIRLLKAGNKTAFLFSTGVIHSHNRDPLYFFKRSFVDTTVLDSLLNSSQKMDENNIPLKDLMERVLGLYSIICQNTTVPGDISFSGTQVINHLKKALQSPDIGQKSHHFFSDPEQSERVDSINKLEVLLADCAGLIHANSFTREDSLIASYCGVLDSFSEYCSVYSSLEGKETELYESFDKLFALIAGSTLATYYCKKAHDQLSETESALKKILEEGV